MNQSSDPVIVIGGGYTGLSAAFEMSLKGIPVLVLEQEKALGGLAGGFELSPGHWIEKFYHHWFTSDTAILSFIEELGMGSHIKHLGSNTGLYYANAIFRLASPLDLLRFYPLPFFDRIRTGLMALAARRIDNWMPLEDISAEDWIIKTGGKKGYDVIWKPLLSGKFGPEAPYVSAVWFWNKLKLRGSSRNKKGGESLVYFSGGFEALTKGMEAALKQRGVEIRTGTKVTGITVTDNRASGVVTDSGEIRGRAVLATTPLPVFLQMVQGLPREYREPASQIRFLGNVCLILRLRRSLSSTYWLNVADPSFPYVGIIEHTNFDDKKNYGGEHIAYLSKYLPTSEAMFKMSDEELFQHSLPHLRKMFPEFSEREWVIGYAVWRAQYSQPVITKNYSKLIPHHQTPIKDLWLSTMAQIYPEDRGTNYAVRHGRMVAREMIPSLLAK